MQTYHLEKIVAKDGKVTIQGLPLRAGEKVEIIILRHSQKPAAQKGYALRGKAVRYDAPFEPAAPDEWNAAQ